MEPDEKAPQERSPGSWLRALRHAVDNLVKINQNLERLRQENRALRQQLIELAQVVHYQAGQIQQIDQRIKDAVEAQVLRELTRMAGPPAPGRSVSRVQRRSKSISDDSDDDAG